MRTAIVQYAASSKEDAMSTEAETPVRNPDDGQEHVDPVVANIELVHPTSRSGYDPVDYGPRCVRHDVFVLVPPRGGGYFDPPGGGGGYSDIF